MVDLLPLADSLFQLLYLLFVLLVLPYIAIRFMIGAWKSRRELWMLAKMGARWLTTSRYDERGNRS